MIVLDEREKKWKSKDELTYFICALFVSFVKTEDRGASNREKRDKKENARDLSYPLPVIMIWSCVSVNPTIEGDERERK